MSYTNNPYCTLVQVKSALDLQTTNDDNWIESDLIPQAQAAIDQFCNRTWQTDGTTQTPSTRYFDGNDEYKLIIDECVSVSTVTEVTYLLVLGPSGIWQPNGSSSVDITQDVVLGPAKQTNVGKPGWWLKRLSALPFTGGVRNYIVSGVFGNPNVPVDVSRACVRLATHYYKMRDSNYADTISEQGGMRLHYKKQMPDDVVEILSNYRRVPMGSRS